MDTFVFALNAILPLVLLVALGSMLRKHGFIDDLFVGKLFAYVYRIALPALLFTNVYKIGSLSEIDWTVVLLTVALIVLFFVLGLVSVIVSIKDNRRRGVVLQAVFRANFALIGVPLATGLGGEEALKIMSLVTAMVIPLTNVLSIVALAMFHRDSSDNRIAPLKVVKSVVTNPLILSVMAGLLAVVSRQFVPVRDGGLVFSLSWTFPFLMTALSWLAQTATPLSLVALGGQFRLSVVRDLHREIIQGVMWKNVIVPAVSLSVLWALRDTFDGIVKAFPALVAVFSAPVAVSSVVITAEMDGDETLAGQIVVWSTFASMFSVFVIVVVFRAVGAL
jgi:malate permease and related proteins